MRRKAYGTGTLTFAVLTVAIAALWVRSDRVADSAGVWSSSRGNLALGMRTTVHEFGFTSADGRITLVRQFSWFTPLDQLLEPRFTILQGNGWRHLPAAIYRAHVPPPTFGFGPRAVAPAFRWLGFSAAHDRPNTMCGRGGWQVSAPYWAMLVATGTGLLACLLGSARQDRAALHGLCRRCGYDLRGTPERCPECGTISKAAEVIGGATGDRR